MTNLLQAAKQALMYLEAYAEGEDVKPYECEGTVLTLRQAIAQAEQQEPVGEVKIFVEPNGNTATDFEVCLPVGTYKLYTAPPQPKAEQQEPVGVYYGCVKGLGHRIRLDVEIPAGSLIYTEPPQQKAEQPVDQQDSDDRRLLREIFVLCEATEDLEAKNEFIRGRIFEAKGIRRGIGTWYQDTFCGRSYMGEPVLNTAPPQREWVEPSDEQIEDIISKKVSDMRITYKDTIRAILKLAKELNHEH